VFKQWGVNIMRYDFNAIRIKPRLSTHDIIIIKSEKEKFEKKIEENREKADRIAKLINENKELYPQSEVKAK
jgi:hypothetical protein